MNFLISAIMPKNTPIDEDIINDTTTSGGLDPETIRKRERTGKYFDDFLVAQYGGKTLKENCHNLDPQSLIKLLNDALRGFFQTMTVFNRQTGTDDKPKRATADQHKSFLKKLIHDASDKAGNLDIDSTRDFRDFNVSTTCLLNWALIMIDSI